MSKTSEIQISHNNVYEEGFERFLASKLAYRLQEKFRDKPFFEKWQTLNTCVFYLSFVFNTVSIVSGFAFLFFGTLFLIGYSSTPPPYFIKVLVGVGCVFLLGLSEFIKRTVASKQFEDYFHYKKFGVKIISILLLSSCSVFISFKGAGILVEKLYPSPTLLDEAVVVDEFDNQIQDIEQRIEEHFKRNNWKGVLVRDARATSSLLQSEKIALERQKNATLQDTRLENKKLLEGNFEAQEGISTQFAIAQIIVEVLLLLCLLWSEFYDFRSIAEFSNQNNKKKQPKTLSKQQVQQKTIEHNGNHYTEKQVDNFIRTYQKRSTNPSSSQSTRDNNLQTLDYWEQRKLEFS